MSIMAFFGSSWSSTQSAAAWSVYAWRLKHRPAQLLNNLLPLLPLASFAIIFWFLSNSRQLINRMRACQSSILDMSFLTILKLEFFQLTNCSALRDQLQELWFLPPQSLSSWQQNNINTQQLSHVACFKNSWSYSCSVCTWYFFCDKNLSPPNFQSQTICVTCNCLCVFVMN